MAKLKDVSKKGRDQVKFLQREVEIVLIDKDKKKVMTKKSVEELVRGFVELDGQLRTLGTMVTDMAINFYSAQPDHPFFFKQGKGFIDYVKSAKDALESKAMINTISALLDETKPAAAEDGKIVSLPLSVDALPKE